MKWYIACSGVSRLTGGSTPKASQVRKMMFFGCPPTQGILALGMNSIGYAPRVFSVMRGVVEVDLARLRDRTTTFSSTVPKRIAS